MTGCIYAAITKQLKNLDSYVDRFEVEVTDDDIHDFRVSVKRLRAYRYFLRINNQADLKISPNLELLYLASGRLRDTTNKLTYLNKIKSTKSAKDSDLKKLDITRDVYLEEFKSVIKTHENILQPIIGIPHQLAQRNKTIHQAEIHLIFNVIIANLDEELNKPDLEINLHEARKLYKKLSYLLEIVNDFNPSGASKKDHKIMVDVEKLLGTWHDLEVLKLEEGNLKSINSENMMALEVEFGVDSRNKLIQLAKSKLKKFQSVPLMRIEKQHVQEDA